MNDKSADITAKKQQIGKPFKPGQSGNPKGRPPGTAYIKLLEKAIHEVEEEKGKSLWKRLIERAFVNDAVLIAVIKKFIPDKTHAEIEIPEDMDARMSEAGETLKKKLNDISERFKKFKETDMPDREESNKGTPQKTRIKKGTLSVVEKKPDKNKEITVSKGMGYKNFDKVVIIKR